MDELKPLSDFVVGVAFDTAIVAVVAASIIGATLLVAAAMGIYVS